MRECLLGRKARRVEVCQSIGECELDIGYDEILTILEETNKQESIFNDFLFMLLVYKTTIIEYLAYAERN